MIQYSSLVRGQVRQPTFATKAVAAPEGLEQLWTVSAGG